MSPPAVSGGPWWHQQPLAVQKPARPAWAAHGVPRSPQWSPAPEHAVPAPGLRSVAGPTPSLPSSAHGCAAKQWPLPAGQRSPVVPSTICPALVGRGVARGQLPWGGGSRGGAQGDPPALCSWSGAGGAADVRCQRPGAALPLPALVKHNPPPAGEEKA